MSACIAESKPLIDADAVELETKASTPSPTTSMHEHATPAPKPPPTHEAYPVTRTPAAVAAGRGGSGCAQLKKSLKQKMAVLCCQQQHEGDPNCTEGAPPRALGDFRVGRQLGEGASASVYEGLDAEFGVRVALKLVGLTSKAATKARMTPGAACSSAATAYSNERNALQAVTHPHVLGLHACSDRESHKGRRTSLLVLERCPNGELYNVMEKLGALDESVARTYAHQLWHGLGACHEQLVFHRDIKPENLLLAEDWSLRIADFGLATVGRRGLVTTTCGTSGYMSPEVYRPRGAHDPARADVWAATCVTFILAMGSPPITAACPKCWFFRQIQNNRFDLFWKAHEKFGPRLSDEFKAFLQRGLNPIMLARPSVESMLADPLFEQQILSGPELRAYMEEAMIPHLKPEETDLDSSFEA
eukprot:CAMPEP_0205921946 /NCGR_PEP_ID=MMETSP1325-20131115/13686_1 /ASSEMBLY_ACC=CAM_ASM_000708 /TAXON_ID=236786 /ORGANISM="Florenciella sp., Strain RCC1007" /LENGTH=417 /DNA_ID=CAMNT_0053289881 /DNA_START=29 /DNA_END=1282 /DNA_ORIENTATION=+